MRFLLLAWLATISPFLSCLGQEEDSVRATALPEVLIQAFEQRSNLRQIPAAVSLLNRSRIEAFNPASIVPALNTLPGVRMEERSPGSYRVNIRGSALRAPFGVRNIKVYFNDLPITDPGGQTYLNQLGSYHFAGMEVIRGPGSSLYGAGTGGVLLITGVPAGGQRPLFAEFSVGSDGLRNYYAAAQTGGPGQLSQISVQHQQSSGYREQSALSRSLLSWNGHHRLFTGGIIRPTFLVGHLRYETPGALTEAEARQNPRSARPRAGMNAGAIESRAAIHQTLILTGFSIEQPLSSSWQNKTALYGQLVELRNPSIRNYGSNTEPHAGGRTSFFYQYQGEAVTLKGTAGAEVQVGLPTIRVFKNRGGRADSLQTADEVRNRLGFLFGQLTLEWKKWMVVTGLSWNKLAVSLQRAAPATGQELSRTFSSQLAPRISIARRIGAAQLYAGYARGFSPPSTGELAPSGSEINRELEPESGNNFELGAKGRLGARLHYDVNLFAFSLSNTIVQRRDAAGGDFYLNAGSTRQQGLEAAFTYDLGVAGSGTEAWLAYTWHRFRYRSFQQLFTNYSGSALPGVAPHILSAGFTTLPLPWLTLSTSYYYSAPLPLNDANDAFARGYHLLSARIGLQAMAASTLQIRFSAGIENTLGQSYTLGPDVNGFGGRYYNPAPGRTFFISASFTWLKKHS
jgi:iron complex outermembrane receptor protein